MHDFFTYQTLVSFAGLVGATSAIGSVVRSFGGVFQHAVVGVIVALLLVVGTGCGVPLSHHEDVPLETWITATVNSFLVYASAAGVVAGADRARGQGRGGPTGGGVSGNSWRWY